MTIRRATLDDLDALGALFDAYRAFYRQAPAGDAARAFLRERLANDESVIFVAEVDGEAAGFCQIYPGFSSVAMCRKCELNDLFVGERFRGMGLGRALTLRALEHAREVGAKRVELATEVTNTRAQGLYEALGFVRQEGFWRYRAEVK